MLTRRFQILAAVGLSAVVATLAEVGCDLNPQPLPPGDTSEDAGGSLTLGGGGSADSGSPSFAADAGTVSPPPVNGGDAGLSGSEPDGAGPGASDGGTADATSDASSEDASPDGQTDASVDVGDGGEGGDS
jgi:hypothetical protein